MTKFCNILTSNIVKNYYSSNDIKNNTADGKLSIVCSSLNFESKRQNVSFDAFDQNF